MELSEKIQTLRKKRGLTQEQLAEQLFVSRTAVSKWETGRGTPNIESLQMIAKLCGITLDELLQVEDVIDIARNENKEKLRCFAFCVDGICNIAAVVGLLLPLYKTQIDGVFYSVPLYQFRGWLAVFYWILPIAMAICGVIQIRIHCGEREKFKRNVSIVGTALNICAILLLILNGQPYPAVLFFVLLLIKGTIVLMKQK